MRTFLKLKNDGKAHLSHFHNFVSAYETNETTVKKLEESLSVGLQIAKATMVSQIVDQDNTDHVFVCHPSGTVALYRNVGNYEVIREE